MGAYTAKARNGLILATGVALACTMGSFPAAAHGSGSGGGSGGKPVVKVIAKGLDNPRQVIATGDGQYVAEAGRGGKKCVGGGSPEEATCIGLTSGISRVYWDQGWKRYRVATGLPSGASKDGGFATGVDGVGHANGHVYGIETWAPPGSGVPKAKPWDTLGKLLKVTGRGATGTRIVSDIAAVELRKNPDKKEINPNPYSVLALDDGRQIVADAGGNDLVEVSAEGRARPLTVFPNHDGNQAVPTSIVLGPDGNYWVGELNGEAQKPTARVWKVSPSGKIRGWVGGFGSVTGVAFNDRGDLYVSQLFAGAVTKVSHGSGKRTSVKVPFPAGVAVDPYHGHVYVAAWSVADRDGAVLPGPTGKPVKSPGGQLWEISGF